MLSVLLDEYYINNDFLSLLKKKKQNLSQEKFVTLRSKDFLSSILNNEKFYIFYPGMAPPVSELKFDRIFDCQGYLFPNDQVAIKLFVHNYLVEEKLVPLANFYDFFSNLSIPEGFDKVLVSYKIITRPENDYISVLENIDPSTVSRILESIPSNIFFSHQEYLIFLKENRGHEIVRVVNNIIKILKSIAPSAKISYCIYNLEKFLSTNDVYFLLKISSPRMWSIDKDTFPFLKWWVSDFMAKKP